MPRASRGAVNSKTLNRTWSPNQLAKRAQIVEGTRALMVASGVSACTARAISDAGAVSSSALHYYFSDMNEVIELAFRDLMTQFFAGVQAAAQREQQPIDALWAAASAYLTGASDWGHAGESRPLHRPATLWFEYQSARALDGDVDLLRELSERGADYFKGLLDAAGVPGSGYKSEVFYSALLGAAVRDALHHRPPQDTLGEIAHAMQLPLSKKFCKAPAARARRTKETGR